MLQHHRIAGDQRGQHGIDRRQIRVIPRRYDHHDAERHPLDLTLKSGLLSGLQRGKRLGCNRKHMTCALLEAADLARCVANGATHLPGDLGGDLARLGDESVNRSPQQIAAYRERHSVPRPLRA